jgi:hypothetical protein
MHFADVDNMLGADFRPTIPGGRAQITANGDEYSVQVSWIERQFDDTDATDGSDTRSVVREAVTLTAVMTP